MKLVMAEQWRAYASLVALGSAAALGIAATAGFGGASLLDLARLLRMANEGRRLPMAQPVSSALPPALRDTRPLLQGSLAKLTVEIPEQLNGELRAQGVDLQDVKVERAQNFGRGLICFTVSIHGRTTAAGLTGFLKWAGANAGAVKVLRVSARPAAGSDKQAEISSQMLILAKDEA